MPSLAPLSLHDAWDAAKREDAAEQTQAVDTASRAMVEYQRRPIDWMVEQMGMPRPDLHWSLAPEYATHSWNGEPDAGWDGDVDPFVQMAEALAHYDTNGVRAVACESGTTTGKTVFIALVVLWFLAVFEKAIVVTVAPKEDQLKYNVWKQIGIYWPRFQALFPQAKKDSLKITMQPGESADSWSAIGFVAGVRADEVAGSATKARGFHAPHMLIVYEEMPGIAPAIRQAFKHTCRAPHNLQIGVGNPDSLTDALHELVEAPGTFAVRISALDHPNVVCDDADRIPGAVSRIGLGVALADAEAYGGAEGAMYKSMVRGITPDQSKHALIRREWVLAAIAHAKRLEPIIRTLKLPQALGVDPANSLGGDPAAIAHFVGPVCLTVSARQCPNATIFGREVWGIAQALGIPPGSIGIDPIGVGAATYNAVAELSRAEFPGHYLPNLNSGGAPKPHIAKPREGPAWVYDIGRFANLRAQMHTQLQLDLQWSFGVLAIYGPQCDSGEITLTEYYAKTRACIGLPDDKELTKELISVDLEDPRGGKFILEPKEKVKIKLGRSPNKGDAVVQGNFVRPRDVFVEPTPLNPTDRSLGFHMKQGRLRPVDPADLHRPDVAVRRVIPQPPKVRRGW